MNTTHAKKSYSSSPSHGLGQPGAGALSDLKISRYKDQHARHKLCVETPDGLHFLDAADAVNNPSSIIKAAADLGIFAWSPASKAGIIRKVEELTTSEPCVTAPQPCFLFTADKRRRAFAYVDAGKTVYRCKGDDTVIVAEFPANPKVKRKGSKANSLAALARFTKSQPIPLFVLLYSLTPLLLEFLPPSHYVENTFLELFGSTTSAKSTLAMTIAGSVWGGSKQKTHFFDDWNTTVNGLESEMPYFNATLMGRDELTLQEGGSGDRRAKISNLIHRLSSENVKVRLNDPKGLSFRTMMITTSNDASTQGLDEFRLCCWWCERPLPWHQRA